MIRFPKVVRMVPGLLKLIGIRFREVTPFFVIFGAARHGFKVGAN
jgi:hypothetical protein